MLPFFARVCLRLGLTTVVLGASAILRASTPELAIVVSVADQRMALLRGGELVGKFPISTSKFGLGDSFGSYRTPLGQMRICEKVGDGLPLGAVLKGREATGEILPVNAPGRDPIVTRILWLEGSEEHNRNARARGIYIHGTPEENRLGEPVSWGCIRMRSSDVAQLFDSVTVGTPVLITEERLPRWPTFRGDRELWAANQGADETFRAWMESTALAVRQRQAAANLPVHNASSRSRTRGSIARAMQGSILYLGLGDEIEAEPEETDAMDDPQPADFSPFRGAEVLKARSEITVESSEALPDFDPASGETEVLDALSRRLLDGQFAASTPLAAAFVAAFGSEPQLIGVPSHERQASRVQ